MRVTLPISILITDWLRVHRKEIINTKVAAVTERLNAALGLDASPAQVRQVAAAADVPLFTTKRALKELRRWIIDNQIEIPDLCCTDIRKRFREETELSTSFRTIERTLADLKIQPNRPRSVPKNEPRPQGHNIKQQIEELRQAVSTLETRLDERNEQIAKLNRMVVALHDQGATNGHPRPLVEVSNN